MCLAKPQVPSLRAVVLLLLFSSGKFELVCDAAFVAALTKKATSRSLTSPHYNCHQQDRFSSQTRLYESTAAEFNDVTVSVARGHHLNNQSPSLVTINTNHNDDRKHGHSEIHVRHRSISVRLPQSSATTTAPATTPKRRTSVTPTRMAIASLTWFSSGGLYVAGCIVAALLVVAGEDWTAQHTLPSRSTRAALVQLERQQQQRYQQEDPTTVGVTETWAATTVRGLAFGTRERQLLWDQQQQQQQQEYASSSTAEVPSEWLTLPDRPSYNEVMEYHRTVRVPRWQQLSSSFPSRNGEKSKAATTTTILQSDEDPELATALETLLDAVTTGLPQIRAATANRDWDGVRVQLNRYPWTQVSDAGAVLRVRGDGVVGWDWGSCAWRQGACRALADTQEAVDEADALLGVLEPYEVLFLWDIVERSLREMLSEAPWKQQQERQQQVTLATDSRDGSAALASLYDAWRAVPAYVPHRVFDPPSLDGDEGEMVDSKIDDEYLQALQSLRIDNEDYGKDGE